MKKGDIKTNQPIPAGLYTVEVEKVGVKEGRDSGRPYLSWQLNILEGDYKGRKLFEKTSLQEQAIFRLYNLLDALQVSNDREIGDPLTQDQTFLTFIDTLKGYKLRVGVKVDLNDQGEPEYNDITEYFPFGEAPVGGTSGDDVPEWAK